MKSNKKTIVSDSALKAQTLRNAARIAAAKNILGEKYILHPANAVTRRQMKPAPVLLTWPVLRIAA